MPTDAYLSYMLRYYVAKMDAHIEDDDDESLAGRTNENSSEYKIVRMLKYLTINCVLPGRKRDADF